MRLSGGGVCAWVGGGGGGRAASALFREQRRTPTVASGIYARSLPRGRRARPMREQMHNMRHVRAGHTHTLLNAKPPEAWHRFGAPGVH